MENEQRIDLDAFEKSDESVCVRVRTELENNNDTAVELEPNSTAAVQGNSRGRSRGRRGNTNSVTSQKRDSGGRVVSDAWNHFKKVKLGEEVQAICNYCGSFKNVQQMHLSFSSKVDGSTSLSNFSSESKWDMATVKLFIARMIVLHELPLAFVEYVGFYDLLKLLQPSIETISRNTIKAEILRLYDVEKKKTMGILEACESRIAITTDMWTASNQKKGYMVITAHYIDSSWVLRSRIMRFIYVPAPHSAEVMCNELYDCLMDWNIDRKLSSVTADNCAANDSMIALLLGKFSTSSMIMVGTMLDPRRKMLLINFLFPKIYGERAESEIERVRKLFVDLVHEYEVNHLSNSSGGVNGANSQAAGGGDSNMLDLDLDEMADEWALFRNENTQNTHSKSELEFYLEECTLPSTSQFDILSWWKNNQGKYPILAKIARDFLAIPVSTVASESAFSTGGRHLSPHRSRLHPSTVEALVCTQNWFWLEQNLKDGIPEEAILSAEHLIDESLMSEQQSNEVHDSEFSL
ncbi:BED-type domain-containing protein [Citrus sinensis]|uniref:BED-type domain-containing protein n=1 Tax=Citrus sinensis TaxID=2711 RepID=A0ACB8JW77_CITSI|nr:BED-type domain-containing protein [Citrus sinensis]